MSKIERVNNFAEYVMDFYGPNGIYDMKATLQIVHLAIGMLMERSKERGGEFDCTIDSIDRERVRDIMIEEFELVFPESDQQ